MATPPVFSAGAVLTAAQMNAVGLWLVKTQSVGTGVSSVNVTSAFSADFDNYYITWTGGTLSGTALVSIYMGASTGTAYYGSRNAINTSAAAALAGDNNTSRWIYASVGTTTYAFVAFDLYEPYAARRTGIHSKYIEGTGALGTYTGYLDNTTSYTSFTLDPDGATTMTGGTIRVYGYRT